MREERRERSDRPVYQLAAFERRPGARVHIIVRDGVNRREQLARLAVLINVFPRQRLALGVREQCDVPSALWRHQRSEQASILRGNRNRNADTPRAQIDQEVELGTRCRLPTASLARYTRRM